MTRPAVLIATKDRPDPLRRILGDLTRQTLSPEVIVVVDASSEANRARVEHAAAEMRASVPIDLLRATQRGVSVQRNLGARRLREAYRGIDLVQVLDDDVRLEPEFLARAAAVIEAPGNEDVLAVAGVTPREASGRTGHVVSNLSRFFGLTPGPPGTVSRTGINCGYLAESTSLREARHMPMEVEWVFGCALVRAEVYDAQRYWEPPAGYVLYDDVDFSLRLARKGRLLVVPDLVLDHAVLSRRDVFDFVMGFQQVAHRHHIVGLLGEKGSPARFWWSVAGHLLILSLQAAKHPLRRPQRLAGAVAGAWAAMTSATYR